MQKIKHLSAIKCEIFDVFYTPNDITGFSKKNFFQTATIETAIIEFC
jgi:hypothetical protein